MFLVVVPVLVPFWLSLGLSMREILEIQAIFGIAVALFEVPTGYVADMWGRRASLIVGTFFSGVGFSILPFADTYWALVLFEVIVAFGGSFVSGADIALVYDSLPQDANRLRRLGSLSQWALVGEAIAAIAASILIAWSFTYILWTQVIVAWIPFVLSWFFIEPPIQKMEHRSPFKNCWSVARFILVEDPLLRLIFLNSLIWGLSSFCIVWLLQPYWTQEGIPLEYFGILWSALMFVAAGASKWTHVLERWLGASGILITLALSACLGYFLMAFAGGGIGVIAGILFYVNRGLASVIFTDAFNWKIPSAFRATANSLRSFAFRLSYGLIGPLTGLVIERYDLSAALGSLGVFYTLLLGVTLLPLCKQMQEIKGDYIPAE
jgi:MFS family permease